jgi:phosphatidylserine/phosphatidylglycerophosphate/cardiolipin synthase-like enzyme
MECDALLLMAMELRDGDCVVRRGAVCEGMKSLSMSDNFTRWIGRLACLFILAGVASCGGALPNAALSRHQAERYYGTASATTPVVSLIRARGIYVPDESSPTPLLEQLQAELAKSDAAGTYNGITYDLTRGNILARDWLIQSPNRWGRRASDLPFYPLSCKDCERDVLLPSCGTDADCAGGGICGTIWAASGSPRDAKRRVCLGHSDSLLVDVHDLVASARQSVDIALLQPAPDTRFLGALRDALNDLAQSRRPVTVRILVGQYPPGGVDTTAFLSELTSELRAMPGSRLTVSVAAMRSCAVTEDCDSYSWNHAKIVTVDGREAMVGGHNMWSPDYLVDNPVHDLSMRVRGPAAASASRFADRLWQYVCANLGKKTSISLASFANGQSLPASACPAASAPISPSRATGDVPILAVGRLGAGITKDFANQSELARDLMLGAAQHSIRIVQQDLGFSFGRADTLFPDSTIDRLVDFLRRRDGHIYIVLSNPGATGNSGSSYSNGVSLATVAKHLREGLQRRIEARDPKLRYEIRRGPDPVNAMLCERVHLAPFRFGPDDSWPGGKTIANHSKFWMIDDRAFYIGSDNMYPVNLQEFGYIVDDRKVAADVLDAYWNPLWQWSQRAAVSGEGVEKCIFREVLK